MKKFNQMTEQQMSQVNGGFIGLAIAGFFGLFGAIVGGSYGFYEAFKAIDEAAK